MNSKVILVTGAGKGIGEAMVKEFMAELKRDQIRGQFFLTARTESDLVRLKKECEAEGHACEILAGELSSLTEEYVAQAISHFGRIDVLVHSAGVGRFGNFLDLTPEDLSFTIDTNITATFLLLQATYRQMQKQKSGTIALLTSVAAEKPFEQSSIYCMSKHAQKGLLEVMRLYGYRDGIRILDVKPGATLTPMWGEVTPEMKERMMTPKQVAQVTVNSILLPMRNGSTENTGASVEEITIRPLRGDL